MGLTGILTGMSQVQASNNHLKRYISANNECTRHVTALVMSSKQQYVMGHTRHVPIQYQYTLTRSQLIPLTISVTVLNIFRASFQIITNLKRTVLEF